MRARAKGWTLDLLRKEAGAQAVARVKELERVMEGMICEKCWNPASGKQGDRSCPSV